MRIHGSGSISESGSGSGSESESGSGNLYLNLDLEGPSQTAEWSEVRGPKSKIPGARSMFCDGNEKQAIMCARHMGRHMKRSRRNTCRVTGNENVWTHMNQPRKHCATRAEAHEREPSLFLDVWVLHVGDPFISATIPVFFSVLCPMTFTSHCRFTHVRVLRHSGEPPV